MNPSIKRDTPTHLYKHTVFCPIWAAWLFINELCCTGRAAVVMQQKSGHSDTYATHPPTHTRTCTYTHSDTHGHTNTHVNIDKSLPCAEVKAPKSDGRIIRAPWLHGHADSTTKTGEKKTHSK